MNYLKPVLKKLWRNKPQTVFNIVSLSIAITASCLIFSYNFYEQSYDSFHEKKDRLYRIQNDVISIETKEVLTKRAGTFYGVEGLIEQEIPEIRMSTHVISENGSIEFDQSLISVEKVFYTNAKFFEMFTFPVTLGNPEDLNQPGSVFISESMANKLFSSKVDALGKWITFFAEGIGRKLELEVKGIYTDFPKNSYFNSELIISKEDFIKANTPHITFNSSVTLQQVAWRWVNFYTFIELEKNSNIQVVDKKIKDFYVKYRGEIDQANGRAQVPIIEAIGQIHLNPNVDNELTPPNDKFIIKVFYVVSILILIISWINYMNISTANAVKRAKEVGVKKSIGAFRSQIFYQLLAESVLVNLFAVLLATLIIVTISNTFESFIGKEIFTIIQTSIPYWAVVFILIILGGFLSGIYPAFIISSFRPEEVLKSSFKHSARGKRLQKSLMILQFLIVCILLSMSFTVNTQIDYMINKNSGFSSTGKIIVKMPPVPFRDSNYNTRVESLESTLESSSEINVVSGSSAVPGQFIGWKESVTISGKEETESISITRLSVSPNFITSYRMSILHGRDFDKNLATDYSSSALINETALKKFGFSEPNEIIGQSVRLFGNQERRVIGIVEDFHQEGLQSAITPMVINLDSIHLSSFLTVEANNLGNAIETVELHFNQMFPLTDFDYSLLSDTLDILYEPDRKFQTIFSFFTGLAIVLAITGLYSLSTFFTNSRRKEISVRKVLGASSKGLTLLLLKEYWKLILISSAISIPLSFYAIDKWLESYSFRIDISALLLVLPIVAVGLLVLLTVLKRTILLAKDNPVKNLRSE